MDPRRVTRAEVDGWLQGIAERLRSIRYGPRGEIVARIGLLERHIDHLRTHLGLPRRS